MIEGYKNLANAIVAQAAKDYRKALRRQKLFPFDKKVKREVAELEAFFRSGWYGLLTSLDGELLMMQLQAEVREVVA